MRFLCRPIILYNVPARTGVRLSVELIERLLENTERIVGLKQCGRDEQLIFKLKKGHTRILLFIAEMIIGCCRISIWERMGQSQLSVS